MIFGFCLLAAIIVLWTLLVEGVIWKLIVLIGAWFGICLALEKYFPSSSSVCFIFDTYSFTWSQVIPSVICLLAISYTKE